jgi:hypothetical protein
MQEAPAEHGKLNETKPNNKPSNTARCTLAGLMQRLSMVYGKASWGRPDITTAARRPRPASAEAADVLDDTELTHHHRTSVSQDA